MYFPFGIIQSTTPVPIEFVAGDSVQGSGASTHVISKPTGTVEGDLVIIMASCRNSFLGLPTGGTTWISKVTFGIRSSSIDNPFSAANEPYYIWYKIAGGSEPATYSLAVTDQGADGRAIIIATFRNASIVDVYDVTTAPAPSIVAEGGDCLISFHGTAFDNSTEAGVSAPGGMTIIDKTYNATGDVGNAMAYELDVAAGATGTRSWTTNWGSYDITGNIVIR